MVMHAEWPDDMNQKMRDGHIAFKKMARENGWKEGDTITTRSIGHLGKEITGTWNGGNICTEANGTKWCIAGF